MLARDCFLFTRYRIFDCLKFNGFVLPALVMHLLALRIFTT